MRIRTIVGIGAALGLLLCFTAARLGVVFYTDWLWFDHLGYSAVMKTMVSTKAVSLLIFWTIFALLAGANVWVARLYGKRTREMPLEVVVGDTAPVLPERLKRQRLIWGVVVAGLGFLMGLVGSSIWVSALRYLHPQSFGVVDPLFGLDVGFYVFRLPVYSFVQIWMCAAVVITAGIVAVSYNQDRSLRNDGDGWFSTPHVRAHFSVLAALLAVLLA